MSDDVEKIEIERYHDRIVHDVRGLFEKYRRIVEWDVPEDDEAASDRLILTSLRSALDEVAKEIQGS